MRSRPSTRWTLPRRFVRSASVLALLLSVATCSGDDDRPAGPTGPDVGLVEIVVSQAPSGTEILLVEVTGSRSGPVTAVGGAELWEHDASSSRALLLLRAPSLPGPVARFPSPDRRESYTVRVLEAAAGASREYAVVDGSEVTVALAPVR